MSYARSSLVVVVAASLVVGAGESGAEETPSGEDDGEGPAPQMRVIERDGENSDGKAAEANEDEPSVSELESRARERELGDGEHPDHEYPRQVTGEVDCPEVELVEYEGDVIAYDRPIEIEPRFRSRLRRFEEIVRDVAEQVYGRPPERVVHYGGHRCKTVGGEGEKLSEHAFGHAIDVVGFDFAAVSDEEAAAGVPDGAAGAFEVRLADHWGASSGLAATHAAFLRRLTEELQRRGPFSTMLGPAYPGHDEVFHFDFGPEFFFRL